MNRKKKKQPIPVRRIAALCVLGVLLVAAAVYGFCPRSLKLDENWVSALRYRYLEQGEPTTEQNQLSWEDMQKIRKLLNEDWHLTLGKASRYDERYAVVFIDPDLKTKVVCLPLDGSHRLRLGESALEKKLDDATYEKLVTMLKPYYREEPFFDNPTD